MGMRLRALKTLPTSVNPIEAGQEFIEENDEKALDWVAQGMAEQVIGAPRPYHAAPAPMRAMKFEPAVEPPAPNWRLDWSGATAVVIASGPSLSEADCAVVQYWRSVARNAKVVAINTSFRRAPFADIVYACDGSWWRAVDAATGMSYVAEALQTFSRDQLWTQDRSASSEFNLQYIRSQRGAELSLDKEYIAQGASSTIQAMGILAHAGVKKIILLGVDCKGKHWHPDHPSPLSNGLPHRAWRENFALLAPGLSAKGIEVINCSPGTALDVFPKSDLASVLSGELAP